MNRERLLPDLVLLPSGHLTLAESAGPDTVDLPGTLASTLQRAFEKSPAEGLLHLATFRHDAALPAAFSYWRHFGERYLAEICQIPESSEDLKSPLPSPREDLEAMACCPGKEFVPPPAQEDLAAMEGRVVSIKFRATR